jgi:hypothetical protein
MMFCAAEYLSQAPVPADEPWTESSLILVWWQEDWALPIDGGVVEEMHQHAWREVAFGWFD